MAAAESILAALAQHPRIDLAILLGSLANGRARPDGDLDLAVHNYGAMDWNIVFNICQHHLDDFLEFAALIHRRLEA